MELVTRRRVLLAAGTASLLAGVSNLVGDPLFVSTVWTLAGLG